MTPRVVLREPLAMGLDQDDPYVRNRMGQKLEQDQWLGPIPSGLGAHLVRVSDRQPARMPALAEVRPLVLREWQDQRRREQKEQAYARLRARYEITVGRAEALDTVSSNSKPNSVADAR